MDLKMYFLLSGFILFFLCLLFFACYQKLKNEIHTLKTQSQRKSDHLGKIREEREELLHEVEKNRSEQNSQAKFYTLTSRQMYASVNAILGMTEIAKNNEQNPGRLIDCHHRIQSNAKYLASLLENVSIYSELMADDIPTDESLDLRGLIQDCFEIAQAQATEQNITLSLNDFISFNPPRILGSSTYLYQVFSILLQNAIQYNKVNGHVNVTSTILSQSEDCILCQFSIQDTGIGMDPEFLTHVFEPFIQENAKLFASYNNTGLSLSIVKQILAKLNGEITVTSQLGIGSEFIITLPLCIDKKYVPENTTLDPSLIRVLLADGNPLNRELIQHRLTEAGLTVEIAEDGRIAVNKIERSKKGYYQFILMDTDIPIMSAIEATKCIRELNHPDAKTISILGMSKYTTSIDTEPFLEIGMNAVLSKPLDMNNVLHILKGEAN